jgi:hypothetical protein
MASRFLSQRADPIASTLLRSRHASQQLECGHACLSPHPTSNEAASGVSARPHQAQRLGSVSGWVALRNSMRTMSKAVRSASACGKLRKRWTMSRHAINVSEAAFELGVGSGDLRRLLWANPKLADAAVEIEERRLDLAEKNIYEALRSNDPRRRDAASIFTIRNSHRARRRGWITTATSAAELSISANVDCSRTTVFRCRNDDDDRRDAEATEA